MLQSRSYKPICTLGRWGTAGLPQGAATAPTGGKGEQTDVSVEGNISETQNSNATMSTKLDKTSFELAKEDGKRQFFSIAHLITPEAVVCGIPRGLRKDASAGVDGVTCEE